MRTLFLLHEQRFMYFQEPSYLELYLPMKESGLLGETMIHPYQRDLRFARENAGQLDADVIFMSLLEQKIAEFRPELVVYALTWPHESIPPAQLQLLKQKYGFRLVSVIWDHDEANPWLQQYDKEIIATSDCTVVADSLLRTTAIRLGKPPYQSFTNTQRAVFLPMVPPASLFFPRVERTHDVTISGSSEGYRLEVCQHLLEAGVQVHRSGGMMPGDVLLPIADYARDLATSKLVVNTQTQGSRVQIKGRVAQCLASGTFLLEQDNVESRAYLEGIDVVRWNTLDELVARIHHYLSHPEEREEMARRAHLQWTAKYSGEGFVRTLLAVSGGAAQTARVESSKAAPPPTVSSPAERVNAAALTERHTTAVLRPRFIHIQTGNHGNHHGIADTVLFLKSALQDCGYAACFSQTLPTDGLSILMENFTPDQVKALADSHAAGARFIVIGTEPISGGSFNGGVATSHAHYGNTDYWHGRFDAFKKVGRLANAIWVLAESMVPAYQALFPDLPVRFLPHGYVSNFATVRQRPEAERDIDFYFSGSLTDHRTRILAKLLARHTLMVNDANTPEYLRQDHLSRAKVCLSLRLSPHNEIPSVSRMHYHLQNSSFVLHETYALPCELEPFVMQVPNDDVAGWAIAALELTNRREIAEAAHARFKLALPMTALLPPLLDEAFACGAAQPAAPLKRRIAVGA